jgi:putative SOS response-associated peptidase YedK
VRQNKEGQRELTLMQWGLVPWFSKDGKTSYSTINARAENVRTNASYREPLILEPDTWDAWLNGDPEQRQR